MPIRPKRMREETCPTCKRPGWRRQLFNSLHTEDEYKQLMGSSFEPVKDLPPRYESMYASCGSTIGSAIDEAITYCKEYKRKGVGFEFNGKAVLVTAKSDADKVYRQWWRDMYHETPEESFAKR